MIGINHYVTSDRYLDSAWSVTPRTHWRQRAAPIRRRRCRPCRSRPGGSRQLLTEAWARYGIPLAVTEAHLGCTREEQMRWLLEVWHGAEPRPGKGRDVRAVTAWSLLGAFDWDSLLTRAGGHYEPGAFDVRAPRPGPPLWAA